MRTTLPASVTTPAAARAVVRDAVERGRAGVRIEDVALVVSELVTNAVIHGRGDITLDVVIGSDAVHVSVEDAGPEPPAPRAAEPADESGRGLLLVSRIASSWGVRPVETGKVVWADVAG